MFATARQTKIDDPRPGRKSPESHFSGCPLSGSGHKTARLVIVSTGLFPFAELERREGQFYIRGLSGFSFCAPQKGAITE